MSLRNLSIVAAIALSLILAGCSLPKLRLPRVHKLTVQQGNVITQDMVDQLRPGMSRTQVAYIMGEPVFRNSFNENRWDYIYYLRIGREDATFKRWISIIFDGNNVSEIVKDQQLRSDL